MTAATHSPDGLHVIVGLGNPGLQYRHSRHNVGFRCLELLGRRHGISLTERSRYAALGQGRVQGGSLVLARPRTFMNESGRAVRYLRDRFHWDLPHLLVVMDDMDLPLGILRLRATGSSGGHNGLQSIIEALDTQEFPRLRIGIGRPQEAREPVGHVLGSFPREDEPIVEDAVARAAQAVETFLAEGVGEAMNRFN